jgi:hypothetical protein
MAAIQQGPRLPPHRRFRWHGDAFNDGQIIGTITPENSRTIGNDATKKAGPAWGPGQHPGSWRAVRACSAKRAARDNKTLTIQENRAREIIAGRGKPGPRGS